MKTVKRPIRIEGDVAYIPLTRGYEAVIDVEDVYLVEGKNWHAHICKGGNYARTWVREKDGKRRGLLLHTAITRNEMTDHQDGNGLNCRRGNMRAADRAGNSQNRRVQKNNLTRLKGVSPTRSGKWLARIAADGTQHNLGVHDSPEAAHEAYSEASKRLHGEFGRSQ